MYQIKLLDALEDCKIVVNVIASNDSGESGTVKVRLSDVSEPIQESTAIITSQWQKIIMTGTPKTGKNHTCSAQLFVNGEDMAGSGNRVIKLCSESNL